MRKFLLIGIVAIIIVSIGNYIYGYSGMIEEHVYAHNGYRLVDREEVTLKIDINPRWKNFEEHLEEGVLLEKGASKVWLKDVFYKDDTVFLTFDIEHNMTDSESGKFLTQYELVSNGLRSSKGWTVFKQDGKKPIMGYGAGSGPGEEFLIDFELNELEKIDEPLVITYHLNLYSYHRIK